MSCLLTSGVMSARSGTRETVVIAKVAEGGSGLSVDAGTLKHVKYRSGRESGKK